MFKSTLEWWAKQCVHAKNKSLFPDASRDVTFEVGYEKMREWANSKSRDKKEWVWARGNLDQLVIDHIEEQLGIEPVFFYNRWRDVRTAIDIFAATETGYCEVPGFDPKAWVIKHDPAHDCCFDALMLIHAGK